jgi:hypothetical protein
VTSNDDTALRLILQLPTANPSLLLLSLLLLLLLLLRVLLRVLSRLLSSVLRLSSCGDAKEGVEEGRPISSSKHLPVVPAVVADRSLLPSKDEGVPSVANEN